jgi:cytochrome c oxidase subunit 3
LWILLAVITSFFGLFISAYGMRMMLADWQPVADPPLLWGNTLVLLLASTAFQWTRGAAQRGDRASVMAGLLASGFFTLTFLSGQYLAWRELNESGHYLSSNAAAAFFFLLTGLHGLHLVGGLTVWAKTTIRTWRGSSRPGEIRTSIELCTTYWHYLLLVWLVLFGLLLTT